MQFAVQDFALDSAEGLVNNHEIRLSELVSAFSVALDITEGQPEGHAKRSCLIGMRIAEHLNLPMEQRASLFYALLLKDLGCSSNAAKMCWIFGADERLIKRDLKLVNWTKMTECFRFSLSHVAPEANPLQRALKMVTMMREGAEGARKLVETRCERGADIARRLELSEDTAEAIRNLDEHWNGRGHPDGRCGSEIPLLARICNLAQTMEVFFTAEGLEVALQVAQQRRGTWFDPALVDALNAIQHDAPFWQQVAAANYEDYVELLEPTDQVRVVDSDGLDRVCQAFADVVDAKSPWTNKHSQGVADIAVGVASLMGASQPMLRDVRRAGLLHDIGKLGVSNAILDKPGKPTDDEFAMIRKHPEFSEQILARVPSFHALSDVAAAHHERLDGRGYHHRRNGDQIPWMGNLLSVADVYEALTAKRPYRDGMPREKALSIMQNDVGTAFQPQFFEGLLQWLDRENPVTRVELQLEAIDQLVASL